MAEAPVPARLDPSDPLTPLQSSTIRYILAGAITSLISIALRVAGKVYDADYVTYIADNGADLSLALLQLWLYYRAYKARLSATKVISTATEGKP